MNEPTVIKDEKQGGGLRVLELRVQDVMRIRMAAVKTDGKRVMVVGAPNEGGKTSLIRSVFMPLVSKKDLPDEPIRKGSDRGMASVDLGDIKAKITFIRGEDGVTRETLVVKSNKETVKRPREFLDALMGKLTGGKPYDPMAFIRMGETPKGRREQVALFLSLIGGYDLDAAEAKKKELYDARKYANYDIENIEGALKALGEEEAIPQPVDEGALKTRLAELGKAQRDLQDVQAAIGITAREQAQNLRGYDEKMKRIGDLERELAEAKQACVALKGDAEKLNVEMSKLSTKRDTLAALKPEEAVQKAQDELLAATKVNEAISRAASDNEKRRAARAKLEKARAQSEQLTKQLKVLEDEKKAVLEKANLPVKGLTFTEEGLNFEGVPFTQAAESVQLTVATVIGFASIPKNGIRVLGFENWDALDAKHRAVVEKITEDMDGQIWAHKVQEGPDGSTLFIEDGMAFTENTEKGSADGKEAAAE